MGRGISVIRELFSLVVGKSKIEKGRRKKKKQIVNHLSN